MSRRESLNILEEEEFDSVQKFNVDRCESLEEMIQELKERDDYNVVWKDETYKGPEPISATVVRKGVHFSVESVRWYSVKVSYEEIKKYAENFASKFDYDEILFKVLKNHPDYKRIVNNSGFPRDCMVHAHNFFELSNDGITFNFGYKETDIAKFERHEKEKIVGKR